MILQLFLNKTDGISAAIGAIRMAFRYWMGKMRRFYQSHLKKDFIASQHARRKGSCQRCGRCCKLGVYCPYFVELEDGGTGCSIYEYRPLQCRAFPITGTDLEDAGCPGFSFELLRKEEE